jgi:hypothetical protein
MPGPAANPERVPHVYGTAASQAACSSAKARSLSLPPLVLLVGVSAAGSWSLLHRVNQVTDSNTK